VQEAELRAQVNGLRAAGRLSQPQADALSASLILGGNRGDVTKVQGFLALVSSLRQGGVLIQAEADALLDLANVLLLSLARGGAVRPQAGGQPMTDPRRATGGCPDSPSPRVAGTGGAGPAGLDVKPSRTGP
jgi:hypothetical protein